jgi:predicted MFS family arabinose efflux permease
LDSAAASSFRADAKVIGVVGIAHALSHFFQLVLPPLFPLLRAEFGVSYATLGALLSSMYIASALCQFGAGFAVDRFGARPVLLAGLGLLAGGTMAAALVPDVAWLFPLVVLMGIGNGVFHPADFAVLNSNVNPRRLGHAYSSHGIGGSLGYALAPVVSFGLGSAFGWRTALLVTGALGLVALVVLSIQRGALDSRKHSLGAPRPSLSSSLELFRQRPILLCFAYFAVLTIATIGISTFLGTSLNAAYGLPLATAATAITAYLLGGAVGVLAGGFLAARTARHDRVAATGLAVGAVLILSLALFAPLATWAIPLLALTGLALGATGPSRDMIVRGATPKGASGRVYGFVYSGLDLGSSLAPVAMGAMLDHGSARLVAAAIAAFLFVAIATVVQVRHAARVGSAAAAAGD